MAEIDIKLPVGEIFELEKMFTSMVGKVEPKDLNRAIARQCRFRVKRRIERLPRKRHLSRGHNTPAPLLRTLQHVKMTGDAAVLSMTRIGRGVDPSWVEYGTKPHRIKKKNGKETLHPGAKPKNPFRNGYYDFPSISPHRTWPKGSFRLLGLGFSDREDRERFS